MSSQELRLLTPEQTAKIRKKYTKDIVDGVFGDLYSRWPLTECFYEEFNPKVMVAFFPKPPDFESEIIVIKYEGGILTPEESLEYRKKINKLILPETNLQLEREYYDQSEIERSLPNQLFKLSLLENLPIAMILFNYPTVFSPEPACLISPAKIAPSLALRYVRQNTGRMLVG